MTEEVKTKIALFKGKKIRKTIFNNEWWFVIVDIVAALTDSVQPDGYIKDMRRRDAELSKGWGQIATTLAIETSGGVQYLNCSNTEGIFRIIQSIPSPKAEPFKRWLARVGYERVQEIQDPELAMKEYAILTNEIMRGTFDLTVEEYKYYKGLDRENLRDHMDDMELILTMLGEATTTKLTKDRNSLGFDKLHKDAKDGGAVAGRTRKDIEKQSRKKVANKKNYLHKPQSRKYLS